MKIIIQLSKYSMFPDECLLYCCLENKYHHQIVRQDSKLFGFHKRIRKQFAICWYPEFYDLHMGEQNENS